MRVIGWETRSRNEGEFEDRRRVRSPSADPGGQDTGTTRSISVGTRKMVNYA
jgi:hypothetical protein